MKYYSSITSNVDLSADANKAQAAVVPLAAEGEALAAGAVVLAASSTYKRSLV